MDSMGYGLSRLSYLRQSLAKFVRHNVVRWVIDTTMVHSTEEAIQSLVTYELAQWIDSRSGGNRSWTVSWGRRVGRLVQ